MHLIDKTRAKKLTDRSDATTNADVSAVRSGFRLLQSCFNPFSDEIKLSASGHLHRRASVMRQDKHRSVIRRFVTPPTFPVLVRPWSPNWAKHVAAENPCSNSSEPLFGHLVIDAGFSVFFAMHVSPDERVK